MKRAASRPPLTFVRKRLALLRCSRHLQASYMDRVLRAVDVSGDGYVMSFVPLDRVGVVDREHFAVGVVDQHSLRAAFYALLGAGGSGFAGTLGAAFVVTDPARDIGGIRSSFRRGSRFVFLVAVREGNDAEREHEDQDQ